MKIVLLHNHYQQAGGEDNVFSTEATLLEAHGHEVRRHSVHNDAIDDMRRLAVARATLWNRDSYARLRALFREESPEIAHFHNTFPLISPAAYYAARAEGVPVVQTLHNYRLMCPNALLYRDGHVCHDCVGRRVAWPAVVHACYRASRPATAVTTAMLALHRMLGTWREAVTTYIALTEFAKQQFVAGGLPTDRIVVKPNAVSEDPLPGDHAGEFALFIGRLSTEKGLDVLLSAWRQLRSSLKLVIVGSGPLDALAQGSPANVEWLGHVPRARVLELMRQATFLVFPSTVYEGFPMTLLEALATGLPVIVSGHGSLAEIVPDGVAGLHVRPGDAFGLAATIRWALAHRLELARMGSRGRALFLSKYTAEQNYAMLAATYQATRDRFIASAAQRTSAGRANPSALPRTMA
ncbi:MAG: glycosyltransferase [Luteitalea sp.]|nr:glycosyltransferase [Luteitalea sp.]